MRLFILVAFIASCALAALPPGYEEEIFCPDKMCIRDRPLSNRRITGRRTMFLECFNPKTKETCRPRAWGVLLDKEYKDTLLREKWHDEKCDEERVDTDVLLRYMLLGSRLDSVIGKLSGLSFI